MPLIFSKHKSFKARNYSTLVGTIVLLCIIAPVSFAQNDSAEEIRQNISDRESEILKLEEEIKEYQKQIDTLGTEKVSLQNTVKTLDATRAKLAKDIALTKAKIGRTSSEISELSRDIEDKNHRIQTSTKTISSIIREIDAASQHSMIEILLSYPSISDFLLQTDELSRLEAGVSDNIKALTKFKEDLEVARTQYEKEQKNLSKLNGQFSDQKIVADNQRKEQNLLLSQTKQQESSYKKLLEQKQARKLQFEREIDDFEAQLKAVIDPSSYPPAGTRVFSSPLGNVFVTQKFGRTVDAKRLYSSGTHNGTDFRASIGTPVFAAASGTVSGTGDTDATCKWASYGKWVLIRHNNGLSTLYAHLELIKTEEGREVSQGDLIGYTGNTGYSTGPHLHFTVFVSSATKIAQIPSKSCPGAVFRIPAAPASAYLDPESYL